MDALLLLLVRRASTLTVALALLAAVTVGSQGLLTFQVALQPPALLAKLVTMAMARHAPSALSTLTQLLVLGVRAALIVKLEHRERALAALRKVIVLHVRQTITQPQLALRAYRVRLGTVLLGLALVTNSAICAHLAILVHQLTRLCLGILVALSHVSPASTSPVPLAVRAVVTVGLRGLLTQQMALHRSVHLVKLVTMVTARLARSAPPTPMQQLVLRVLAVLTVRSALQKLALEVLLRVIAMIALATSTLPLLGLLA